MTWSDGPRTSRRDSACMMLSGCGSNMCTRTYRCFSSYDTRNSVLNDGVVSTRGSNCTNSEKLGASRQTASSARPSMAGDGRARTAVAVVVAVVAECERAEIVSCTGAMNAMVLIAIAERNIGPWLLRVMAVGQGWARIGW